MRWILLVGIVAVLSFKCDASKCRSKFRELTGREGWIPRRCRSANSLIGEEYWTTIGYDGQLRNDRSIDDFLTFPTDQNNGHVQKNSFIGYWITRSRYGSDKHYESFGHVFVKPSGQVCGWFVGMNQDVVEVCGGFRVLSRNSRNPNEPIPFEWVQGNVDERDTLGFHQHRIAKYEYANDDVFFGDARLADNNFQGVSPNSEQFVQVNNRDDFSSKVWLLKKRAVSLPQNVQRPYPPPQNVQQEREGRVQYYADPHQKFPIVDDRRAQQLAEYYRRYGFYPQGYNYDPSTGQYTSDQQQHSGQQPYQRTRAHLQPVEGAGTDPYEAKVEQVPLPAHLDYNAQGRRVASGDPSGGYDQNGRPVKNFDAHGQQVPIGDPSGGYGVYGRPVTVLGQNYNAHRQPVASGDPSGGYDQYGRRVGQDFNNPRGQPMASQGGSVSNYNAQGHPVGDSDPSGGYDEFGRPVQNFNSRGQPVPDGDPSGGYDMQGRPVQVPVPNFDANGRRVPLADPSGGYDQHGRRVGAAPGQDYNSQGQPVASGDPSGGYDQNGRRAQNYDAQRQQVPVGDPSGGYDVYGRPVYEQENQGREIEIPRGDAEPGQNYNAQGQPVAAGDPSGGYDQEGRPVVLVRGAAPAQNYDVEGRPAAVGDSSGGYERDGRPVDVPREQNYNAQGQPVAPEDPSGGYDQHGRPAQNYNAQRQRVPVGDPSGGYDVYGRRVPASGQNYSARGQPVASGDPSGGYDQYGRRVGAGPGQDNNTQGQPALSGDTPVGNDQQGRPVEVPRGGAQNYNAQGQPVASGDPSGGYDVYGRPVAVPGQNYNAYGQPVASGDPSGGYDQQGRLVQVPSGTAQNYNAQGEVVPVGDPSGGYDQYGNRAEGAHPFKLARVRPPTFIKDRHGNVYEMRYEDGEYNYYQVEDVNGKRTPILVQDARLRALLEERRHQAEAFRQRSQRRGCGRLEGNRSRI